MVQDTLNQQARVTPTERDWKLALQLRMELHRAQYWGVTPGEERALTMSPITAIPARSSATPTLPGPESKWALTSTLVASPGMPLWESLQQVMLDGLDVCGNKFQAHRDLVLSPGLWTAYLTTMLVTLR